MSKEILIIIWMGVMGVLSTQIQFKKIEFVEDKKVVRYSMGFALFVFLPIIIWAGFRDGTGYADTNAYIALYKSLPENMHQLLTYLGGLEKDWGFYFFSGVIKQIFGEGYRPFLLIIAIVQGMSLIKFYQKYSENYVLSIALFILSGEYMGWMMNGMRQFLAVCIIYFAIPWIVEKKYIRCILVILLASTIHQTAIIMLPIIFIVQGKPWNKKTIATLGIALVALIASSQFTNFLNVAMEDTVYATNISEMVNQTGTNPIRVLVYSLPALLSLLGKRYIENKSDTIVNITVNMSIITMALSVIGMMTSGVMIGRLSIYTSLFNYVLLPYELDNIFEERTAKILKVVMIIMYIMYYYYMMHFAYGRI